MSTRSGDLDPGLAWYLARTEGMTAKQFDAMVTSESGLLGISETSGDMRDLLRSEANDTRAAEAVSEGVISAPAGRVPVRVIRTDEERMIAKTVCRVPHLGSDRET